MRKIVLLLCLVENNGAARVGGVPISRPSAQWEVLSLSPEHRFTTASTCMFPVLTLNRYRDGVTTGTLGWGYHIGDGDTVSEWVKDKSR